MKNTFAIFLILSLSGAASIAAPICTTFGDARSLTLVSPSSTQLKKPVKVSFELRDSILIARFEVRTPDIYGKEKFAKNEFPYMFDAVEVFVSVAGAQGDRLPYFEYELTPYEQTFQVKVLHPKKPFQEGLDLGLKVTVEKFESGWLGTMLIPLSELGWNGDPSMIVGNAYGIFGKPGSRSFWALTMPPQPKPKFHQPEFFQPFFKPSDCFEEVLD